MQPHLSCQNCQKPSYTLMCVKCMNDINQKETFKNKTIGNNKIMKINDILKIKLKKDNPTNPKEGKEPINSWTNPNNQSKKFKPTSQNNIGIVCNEVSGVFGLDLDFYVKESDDEPWDADKCPFTKQFGTPEQFIKKFNTFTQKTTSGGTHLLFQHQEGLKQSQNKTLHIDTRGGNTNGYLVGFNSVVNGKKYTIELEQQIQPIPADLLEWLNNDYWEHKDTSNTTPKKQKKGNTTTAVQQHQNKKLDCIYKYEIIDNELENTLKGLPKEYFENVEKWLCFTSAMKQVDKKDLWDKLSKQYGGSSYNQIKNLKYWDSCRNNHEECSYFENILYQAKSKMCVTKQLGLIKYKPLLDRIHKPDETIDMAYLTGKKSKKGFIDGFDFSGNHKIIQSDTGTAKTTGFKNYIKNTNQKFISIVSRRILAIEQHADFNKTLKGRIDYYENGFPDSNHQGFVCCLDSIMKIDSWDNELENRVVFLDEFNSLVEYLLSSPTMDTKRVEIFDYVVNTLFMKAKQLICVDADISDISMNFIRDYIEPQRKQKFTYIVNTHKHNKGVKAQEYFSKNKMVEEAKKSNAFLFACDSKREAIDIWKKLHTEEDPIKLIVARDDEAKQNEEHINFADYKKIIFSPKVIYGNDSVYPNGRDVFAYYLEKTISPTAFFQQIARERSINKLHYCFEEKRFEPSNYKETKDVVKDVAELQKISLERFEFSGDIDLQKMFLDLSVQLLYKKDCYNTNKYVHFKHILPQRGFIDIVKKHICTVKKTQADKQERKKNLEEWKQDIWNAEEALKSRVNEDVLKLTTKEEIEEFKHLFLDTGAVKCHLMGVYYFLKHHGELKNKINKTNEFPLLKLNDSYCQLDTMINLMKEFGYEKKHLEKMDKKGKSTGERLCITQTEQKDVTDEMVTKFNKLFKGFFVRSKLTHTKEDLQNEYKFKEYCVKMIECAVGKNFVKKRKCRISKTETKMEYTFNEAYIARIKKCFDANSENKYNAMIASLPTTYEFEDDSDDEN